MIDITTILSALLGMGGFIWLLKYQKYSRKNIQEYSKNNQRRYNIFLERFWKEYELQNKYGEKTGAPINDSKEEFFLQHKDYQCQIAILAIIIGFGLQLLNGFFDCLWCY